MRQYDCSTLDRCYDAETETFDDTRCQKPNEKCGRFAMHHTVVGGCIQYQYCNTIGYYKGPETENKFLEMYYSCPSDIEKPDF